MSNELETLIKSVLANKELDIKEKYNELCKYANIQNKSIKDCLEESLILLINESKGTEIEKIIITKVFTFEPNHDNATDKLKQLIFENIMEADINSKPTETSTEDNKERSWRSGSNDEPTQADKDANVKIEQIKEELKEDLTNNTERRGR